jgi:protein-disulfide isomerase
MSIFYKFLWGLVIVALAYTVFGIANFKLMHHGVKNPRADFQVLHNPDAPITFIEFLNYGCGYCKDLHPIVNELAEVRKDVKIIVRPIVFDGVDEDGTEIVDMPTRIAFAAGLQGKFKEFHAALLEYPDPEIPDSFVEELAMLYGLNYDQLVTDIQGNDVQKIMDENLKRFDQLGLYSVPSFMINDTIHVLTDENLPDLKQILTLIPTN